MRPNVAVVVLDTLRRDRFRKYFDWLPGRFYSRAYSTSHWTIPAHASLYTGQYGSELGVTAKSPSLNCDAPTLPEMLSKKGYTTRLFTANPQIIVWDGWERGFDEIISPSRLPPEADNTFEWNLFKAKSDRTGLPMYAEGLLTCIRSEYPTVRSIRRGLTLAREGASQAEDVTRRVSSANFKEQGEFLLVNLMDSHTPYDPPAEYATVETPQTVTVAEGLDGGPEDPDIVKEAYDNTTRYLSDTYQNLFAELIDTFDYVVTVSDHGELLGEEGWWNHGIGLRPELCHVPLVVSGEGFSDSETDTPASLVDIPVTIARLTDTAFPTGTRGTDLRSLPEDRTLLTEYHGLLPFHEDQFERHNVTDQYDKFDIQFDGVVTGDGYAYQTPDGEISEMGGISEPKSRLNRMREDVPRVEQDVIDDVSAAVEDQLKDLGYA